MRMATTSQQLPEQTRVASVSMGDRGMFRILLRLIAMELYKMRRRALFKVLLLVGIMLIILILGGISYATWKDVTMPAADYSPPLCASDPQAGCVNGVPTLAEKEHYKQIQIDQNAHTLGFPGSLQMVTFMTINALPVLLIILIGTNVGEEYSLGTIRLLFTRGPSRMQFLAGKIGAAAVYSAVYLLILAFVLLFLGAILEPISQVPIDYHFLTLGWIGQALLYLVLCILNWFLFSMLAFFFAVVGRSTVAGIVGPLIWIFLEEILGNLPHVVHLGGPVGDFIAVLPQYFLGNNAATLIMNRGHILYNGTTGLVSDQHAWIMVLLYLVCLIGGASWLTARRNITN